VALIYPVISFEDPLAHIGSRTNLLGENPAVDKILAFSANRQVNKNSPPAFLIHSADDKTVPVENSLAYYEACLKHGIPAEMHLYPRGGHGFGMYNQTTPDFWMDRLINWLRSL
jgi:dipeptidyl aminopeptidase/acylaminoacyl peptidase